MAGKSAKVKTSQGCEAAKEESESELESINLSYKGKEYTVKFPKEANSKAICQNIKSETGVKGAFYVHFGDKSNSYLHCSSITRGNLAKLVGKPLGVRGGNETNEHDACVTFSLHSLGIQAFRGTTSQYAQL